MVDKSEEGEPTFVSRQVRRNEERKKLKSMFKHEKNAKQQRTQLRVQPRKEENDGEE